jgi:hypothetical protein
VALDTAGVVGGLSIASFVPGILYDRRAGAGNVCLGSACWAAAFWFIVGTSAVAAASGALLTARKLPRYRELRRQGNA